MFRAFNRSFEALASGYARGVKIMARTWQLVFLAFAGLAALAYLAFAAVPTGFVPEEDQGYLLLVAQLPEAAAGGDGPPGGWGRGARAALGGCVEQCLTRCAR